jgi:hypothetical protein
MQPNAPERRPFFKKKERLISPLSSNLVMVVSPHAAGMYRLKTIKGRQVHRMKPALGRAPKKARQELAAQATILELLRKGEDEKAMHLIARMRKRAQKSHIA